MPTKGHIRLRFGDTRAPAGPIFTRRLSGADRTALTPRGALHTTADGPSEIDS